MIDDLRPLAIFCEAVRQGSFRGAARKLGLSPPAISYNIAQLETRLGTALIYRSTRKLSLTADGEGLFAHAVRMLEEAEKGFADLSKQEGGLHGVLHISATTVLMHAPLNKLLGEFALTHPKLELHVHYNDARSDLVAEGVDLAFRAGVMQDSGLKSRRIDTLDRILVCAPSYLEGQPTPLHPSDLADWSWIQMAMMPHKRSFVSKQGDPIDVAYIPSLTVNSVQAMVQFCKQGLGLATPTCCLVDDAIKSGELVALLPAFEIKPMPLYMVWPDAGVNLRATRTLIDFIVERV